MKAHPHFFLAALPAAFAISQEAPRPADDASVRAKIDAAVAAVYPALVKVEVVAANGVEGRMKKGQGSGSGAIISAEGHVLTNHHVAGDATRLTCRLSNREEVPATLVGTDALSDLAVLKLDLSRRAEKAPLPVAKFGDSDKVRVGDVVLAMGSPAGLSQSVTSGIVANTEMISPGSMGAFVLDGENVGELVRWIGHDAVIYPGNSGGPLVNLSGEIVGVNEVGIGSLGGAIPANLARGVARELIEKGFVSRSWIGLSSQPLLKHENNEKGVLVASVAADGPAAKAGLEPGDILTHFDGAEVTAKFPEELPDFNRRVLATPIGKEVEVRGFRKGEAKIWKLTTVVREPAQNREVELKNWGMTALDLTRGNALALRRASKDGVLVHSVAQGGPCLEAKPALRPGDVIVSLDGKPVKNLKELRESTASLTQGNKEPQPVLVAFERGVEQFLTQVKVGAEPQEDKPKSSRKAWLGISTQVLTRDLASALKIPGKKGVRVTQVLPDTAAQRAGFKVGDLILKMDDQIIQAKNPEDQDVFENMIRDCPVDSDAKFSVLRDGQEVELPAKLEARPAPEAELAEYENKDFEFTVRDLSFRDKVEDRNPKVEGVIFTKVQNAGWADVAGLSVGDILLAIDDQPVKSVADVEKILQAVKGRKASAVVFFAKRGSNTFFRELLPVWE